MRRLHLITAPMSQVPTIVLAFALVSACGAPSETASTESTSPPTTTTTSIPVTSTEASTTTTLDTGPVEVSFPERTGGGVGGNTLTTVRLAPGTEYRFGMLVTPLRVRPPDANWEVRDYSDDRVRMRWRGDGGFSPGTLVVTVFGVSDITVEERWAELEAEISSELAAVTETLTWVDTGTTQVGGIETEWRELRTTENKPLAFDSSPCVIEFGENECVWFESSARVYVVPLDDLNVTVVATEQMCDCDLGGLGSFSQDNELHDWLPELDAFLAAFEFEY